MAVEAEGGGVVILMLMAVDETAAEVVEVEVVGVVTADGDV